MAVDERDWPPVDCAEYYLFQLERVACSKWRHHSSATCGETFQKSDRIDRRGITAGDDESMCRRLKKRCFAVRSEEGDLYLNCRKLRYKKLRFGAWYAPAVQLGKNIYFCAMPLGSVIGGNFVEDDDVKLGGNIGDALAASSLVTKRVCYELNGETGKIEFLGKDKMLQILDKYPEWKQAYLKEDSQEAKETFDYLLKLRDSQEK